MLLACRQIYNSLGTKCRLCILHLLSIGFSISALIGYKDRNKSCWHSFGNTIPINDSPKHVEVLSDVAGNSTLVNLIISPSCLTMWRTCILMLDVKSQPCPINLLSLHSLTLFQLRLLTPTEPYHCQLNDKHQ